MLFEAAANELRGGEVAEDDVFGGAPELGTFACEQPDWVDAGLLDEAEEDFGGHGDAGFVVVPGSGGQIEPAREFRTAVFAESLDSDGA
jgi:hypothetical protein